MHPALRPKGDNQIVPRHLKETARFLLIVGIPTAIIVLLVGWWLGVFWAH